MKRYLATFLIGLTMGLALATEERALRTIGVCHPAPNELFSLENVVAPNWSAAFYLRSYEHKEISNTSPATVTILQQPSHGVLRLVTEADGDRFGVGRFDPSDPGYVYLPQKGYVGKDKAVALVEVAGVKIKVIYYFQAIVGPRGDVNELCGTRGYRWKISSILDVGSST